MIKMPYEQIIAKIKDSSGMSAEEVEEKVRQKMDQLSGLISKEGAAHIVANEIGVKLIASGKLKIKDILSGMRSVETVGKVTQVYELREFVTNGREGKVGSFLMGDDTGVIRVVLWGSNAEQLKELKEGTVVKIIDSYVKDSLNGRKELHLNNNSRLLINPEGEKVADYKRPEASRKKISQLAELDNNVELLGTIVSVFLPTFFVPKNKRAEDGTSSPDDMSYAVNFVMDDGTDTIRVVCFREQAERLLGKTRPEILEFKDQQEKFDPLKTELLGNMIKVNGRVSKNEMFQRLEFVANSVDTKINVEEELKAMEAELEKSKILS